MAETTVRRVRRRTRLAGLPVPGEVENGQEADRRNAAAALQRALDRRDNGGAWGHGD